MPFAVWLPGIYLAFAVYGWVDFVGINHDGLANLGLMLLTFPVTVAGLLLGAVIGSKSFSLMPQGYGYLTDHALYYVPAVALTALLFWWLGRIIDRFVAKV